MRYTMNNPKRAFDLLTSGFSLLFKWVARFLLGIVKSSRSSLLPRPQTRFHLAAVLFLCAIAVAGYFSVRPRSARGMAGPSVVINKYFNSGTTADIVELLVIQDNLDMRGMIIKDFSSNMANDGGGKYIFSNDALWSSVRTGTLIVLRNDNSAADT